jgi:D-alanyl-D-alanine dipeptidase
MKRMLKNIMMSLAGVSLLWSCTQAPSIQKQENNTSSPAVAASSPSIEKIAEGLTEISLSETGIRGRMPYADESNFTGQKIYPCARCFLREEAARALLKADSIARSEGLNLVILDCYRPTRYQKRMFELVPDPRYVADTVKGSMHNKAAAVDITLSRHGKELDMGTSFDDFSERSHSNSNKIPLNARKNRGLLKSLMIEAGFKPYAYEWWHFNYPGDFKVQHSIWSCPDE